MSRAQSIGPRLSQLVLDTYRSIRELGRPAKATVDQVVRQESWLHSWERRHLADAVFGLLRREVTLDALLASASAALGVQLSDDQRIRLLYAGWRVMEGEPHEQVLAQLSLAPEWLQYLRRCADWQEYVAAIQEPDRQLAVAAGLPFWLAQTLLHDYGPEALALASASNERAPLTLRANRLRCHRQTLAARLAQEGVASQPTRWAPDGLHLLDRVNVPALASFREGWFEVQDEGSQLLAMLLPVRPGWTVVDACAGAGGKSLALAAAMGNRGRLWACDVDRRRLARLPPRARRAGAQIIRVCPGPAPAQLTGRQLDAVFIDAPCSGTGVMRRDPEVRFRVTPADVDRLAALQLQLLLSHAPLVRPGGYLLYATCSVLRQENDQVAEAFQQARPDFRPVPVRKLWGEAFSDALGLPQSGPEAARLRLLPHRHGTDGFFGVLFQRGR